MSKNNEYLLVFLILSILIFTLVNTTVAQEEYTVSVYTTGLEIDSITVPENQQIELPEPPERDGYTFAGWYTNEEEGQYNAFTPETKINSNLELHARWIPYVLD